MQTADPKVLSKIKKCLALAKSDNANEAATALRQAHALMAKHGVSQSAVGMGDIGRSTTPSKTMARDKPAQWEVSLAVTVGEAFGCALMMQGTRRSRGYSNESDFVFVGIASQAEIAAYTASVLIRKCKSARQKWIAEKFKHWEDAPGVRKQKRILGDTFANGWVMSIAQVVREFAAPPDIKEAIDSYVQSETQGRTSEARQSKADKNDRNAAIALQHGFRAAAGESIYRPMKTGPEAPALPQL